MVTQNTTLLIDASTPLAQTGLWQNGAWLAFFESEEPAITSLFQGIESVFKQAKIQWSNLSRILYCQGPGSILGTRITAMAITAWQKPVAQLPRIPLYSYNSLMAGKSILNKIYPESSGYAIAPARQGRWHVLSLGADNTIKEIEAAELQKLKDHIYYLPSKKLSAAMPSHALALPYQLKNYPQIFTESSWIQTQSTPTLYSQDEPTYAHWSGERHR